MIYIFFSIFTGISISSILCGVYLLYVNIDAVLNRLAFLCCVSLSCWCLGAGLSLIASSYSDSIIWRRFAAIGVTTFFSFFLHYIILLTAPNKFRNKSLLHYALYLPSMLFVYMFALSNYSAHGLYSIKWTSIGWLSNKGLSIWVHLYDLYVFIFMLIGLTSAYLWRKKNNNSTQRKQANLILLSYLITFFISIAAELVEKFPFNISSYLHEIAPFIVVIPILNVFYLVRRQDFMKKNTDDEVMIFIHQFRTKITHYLSRAFFIGALLNIAAHYLQNQKSGMKRVVFFSCILIFFGLSIQIIQRIPIKKIYRQIAVSTLLTITIPVVILHFIGTVSITIWAYPFILIIATLLFHDTAVITMLSASTLITLAFVWIKVPHQLVNINTTDYTVRMGLMVIAIYLVYYINSVYQFRLRQLSDKISSQELVAKISSIIINMDYNESDKQMNEVLRTLCKYLNADRAHICNFAIADILDTSTYYYYQSEPSSIPGIPLNSLEIINCEWWKKQVQEKGTIQIPCVQKLPKDATAEKQFLEKQLVKSILAVPLISHEKKIGFLRIDWVTSQKNWDEELVKVVKIIGNIIGEANIKVHTQSRIHQMAYYDQLTKIPNRQLFGERITQEINVARQNSRSLCIVFLDLDSFKTVNDTIGHDYGDKLLILVAEKLKSCLRKTDVVSRFGGDEFLIMLNNVTEKSDIEVIIAKIMKQFDEPVYIDGQEFYITASAGISVFPADGTDKETLIKNADIAMYRAKSNGKNQYVFCSVEMKEELQETMRLTNHLYHALAKQEIKIAYQPQIDLASGQMIAVEALARWVHPEFGFVSPAVFIPIAEHTGLINDIGEWILRETCKQVKLWQQQGLPAIRVAVNVSVNQLLKPNFIQQVLSILHETELDSQYLELEITENIAMQESDFFIGVLSELKSIGVTLAIDDFGIEYSSLNRIKMLPVDRIKIDMHFIQGILISDKDKVIVDVIIKLAKDLNLKVIAEGVEQEEQLNYLKEKHCDEAQGYYFYKPLSREDMENLLITIK